MPNSEVFTQSIEIQADLEVVENCITDINLIQHWLNPVLCCEPLDKWSMDLGNQAKFIIKIPIIMPTLLSTIVVREAGLLVWEFSGFFTGRDHWEYQTIINGTLLLNRFEFQIPNPLVFWGFNAFARGLTRTDMQVQLQRIKIIAETIQSDYK
ncbi:SRPBCC family protein [Richelia intracellularis]|uniref:SRPBCC family protein n=1 Tax=Richelia intracellularis TaxID=1164990 RepID=UPI0005C5227C|nr:SRPBCC family protein [Richelia intracellularis]